MYALLLRLRSILKPQSLLLTGMNLNRRIKIQVGPGGPVLKINLLNGVLIKSRVPSKRMANSFECPRIMMVRGDLDLAGCYDF